MCVRVPPRQGDSRCVAIDTNASCRRQRTQRRHHQVTGAGAEVENTKGCGTCRCKRQSVLEQTFTTGARLIDVIIKLERQAIKMFEACNAGN